MSTIFTVNRVRDAPARRPRSTRTSLRALFDGATPTPDPQRMGVREAVSHLAAGGWPANLDLGMDDALDANAEYLHAIVHVDLPRVDGERRDPDELTRLVRGFARNAATDASLAAIALAGETSASVNTRTDHTRALGRLYLIEDQPAWSPRLRSRMRLAVTPKRHLAEPSLAVAALGATPERLLVVAADTPTYLRPDGVLVTSLASLGP